MKVQGPGSTQGPSKSKKAAPSAAGGGASFSELVAGSPAPAEESAVPQSIAQVDALLAIQGAEDPTERSAKNKGYKRSNDILDGLEKIRLSMLKGELTVGDMVDIADVVASHRENITDPSLTSLMDEVDLRAQVELAKMRMAMNTQGL